MPFPGGHEYRSWMQLNAWLPRFIYLSDIPIAVYGVFFHGAILLFIGLYLPRLRLYHPQSSPWKIIGTLVFMGYLAVPLLCYSLTGKFGNSAYLSLVCVGLALYYVNSLSLNEIISLGDIAIVPGTLAFGLMKVGCLFAGCCYGSPTQSPLFVSYTLATGEPFPPKAILHHPHWESVALNPIQLWTALWACLLCAVGCLIEKRGGVSRGIPGMTILGLYCLGRFIIDGYSGDPREIWGAHPNHLLGIAILVALAIVLRKNPTKALRAAQ